ncbi:MAG: amidohydrolase [Bacteroidetes bacterium]|nr:amidohydrolase [Bacteroidota bacterium]
MNESLKENIRAAARTYFPLTRDIRRHLHRNPEPSFSEFETSAFLKAKLEEAGIPIAGTWVKTGFMVELKGAKPGKTVTLRADMDALPIQESNNTEYASRNAGWMHACGHDVHSACQMGAIFILNELREHWSGTIRFVFQPGEEVLPGGASLMLREGMFEQFPPGNLIAQHVFPELPAGHVGFRPGQYMASTDELHITIHGKGGHGALPHTTKDPVLAAAQVIVALQQIASRKTKPGVHTVLSIGKVIANGATNVIPAEVQLQGTFRTLDEEWRAEAHQLIDSIVQNTCLASGVRAEIEIRKGYPALSNDVELTKKCKAAAEDFLGSDRVHDLDIRMTAEDFAWFAQRYPACFYRLGTASPDGKFTSGVHTNTFDIDEDAMLTGSGLMAWLAISESH